MYKIFKKYLDLILRKEIDVGFGESFKKPNINNVF